MAQEVGWRKEVNAEALDTGKVSEVVRNDSVCAAGDGQFGDHVVVGITEQRSPKEEDILLLSNEAQVIDHRPHVVGRLPPGVMAHQGGLVFDNQRNGDGDLEPPIPKELKQFE